MHYSNYSLMILFCVLSTGTNISVRNAHQHDTYISLPLATSLNQASLQINMYFRDSLKTLLL